MKFNAIKEKKMLTVLLYFIKNENSKHESFIIHSSVNQVYREEYYIGIVFNNGERELINENELESYKVYGSGVLIKEESFV